jgi:hypothetical protein
VSVARILVVEDEAIIADDVQRTLVQLGYEAPGSAATGNQAIAMAHELRPDLVLMDIQLRGGIDGIETAGKIRAALEIPVIFLTSHSDDATLARAKLSRPQGYLLKPFSDRELRTAIEVALHNAALERRIAERERWFSTTLSSIGDAVIATDVDHRVTFMNAVAERLTGWSITEASGRPVVEVLRLVDRAGADVESPVIGALRDNAPAGLPPETSLVTRDGRTVQIDDAATPIAVRNGNVLGAVIVFRDVTDRRRLEARVTRSERLAAVGTLAAGVAHEINNPLTYVVANVEFAHETLVALRSRLAGPEGLAIGEELREVEIALRDAAEGGDRVRDIVQSLGRFARTDDPRQREVSLPSLLDSTLRMTAASRRVTVRRDYGECPEVVSTEGALSQLFGNLIVNACDALAGRQGTIVVSTSTDSRGWAIAEISDDGPGLREPHRIFDLFYTTKPVGQGMGLGLSICHEIVASLGGAISAENRPTGGACFRVELPPSRGAKEPAHESPPETTVVRRRVLVVDDEPSVASAISRMIRQSHTVDVAHDVPAARLLLATNAYDVILCDLMMPDVSGVELFEELTSRDPSLASRFVLVTGGALDPRATALLSSGRCRFVTKPVSADTIRGLVAKS